MVKLIARRPLVYAGRRVAMGETFEASPSDARLLVAVRSATLSAADTDAGAPTEGASDAPAPPKRKRGRPRKVQGDDHEPRKRTYKRRDMEAE
jgi:hypothetical protein